MIQLVRIDCEGSLKYAKSKGEKGSPQITWRKWYGGKRVRTIEEIEEMAIKLFDSSGEYNVFTNSCQEFAYNLLEYANGGKGATLDNKQRLIISEI